MSDFNPLIERYFAIWNETDGPRRRALIAESWTETGSYVDPKLSAEGHDGLDAMVRTVHEHYPGLRFRLIGDLDSHNDRVRFRWTFAPEAGPALASGLDVAVVAADGRLQSVTGFFDELRVAA